MRTEKEKQFRDHDCGGYEENVRQPFLEITERDFRQDELQYNASRHQHDADEKSFQEFIPEADKYS